MPAEWSERFPPFDASAVVAGADGRIWVGAPILPGVSPKYDVFDQTGKRVLQVEVRPGRRIVHVGARGVYAVVENDDGGAGMVFNRKLVTTCFQSIH